MSCSPASIGFKRERIHLDGIKKIFAALLAGKEIVNPREQPVAAELPGIARAFQANGFRQVQAMLAGLARQQVRASHAVEDRRNLDQHVAGIAVRLLQVARKLSAEVADPARRETAGQRQRRGFGSDRFLRRCR